MNDDVIKLVTVTGYKKDKSGFKNEEITETFEMFAEVKSVGRAEYYEAMRNGMTVNIIFLVNPDDYDLATVEVNGKKVKASKVIYDDTTYLIKRTYKKDMHSLELTCQEVE